MASTRTACWCAAAVWTAQPPRSLPPMMAHTAAAALTADAVPVPPAAVAAWLLAPFAVAAAVVLFVKLRKKN